MTTFIEKRRAGGFGGSPFDSFMPATQFRDGWKGLFFSFFFLSCVVVVGSSHSTLQKSWPLPQKAMFIDTHPRRGRHTSVSFPIWFVQLLTLAPPFCSPTTTTARRRRKQKTKNDFSKIKRKSPAEWLLGPDLHADHETWFSRGAILTGFFSTKFIYKVGSSFLSVRLFYFFWSSVRTPSGTILLFPPLLNSFCLFVSKNITNMNHVSQNRRGNRFPHSNSPLSSPKQQDTKRENRDTFVQKKSGSLVVLLSTR